MTIKGAFSHKTTRSMVRKIIFCSLVILLSCKAGQRNGNGNLEYRNDLIKEIKFVKANTETIREEDTVVTMFEGEKYTICPDGKIMVQRSGDQIDSLKLSIKDIVETAFFYHYKNDFIVFYTETDYDAAGSYAECFDRNSFKVKWKNTLGGFNLASPCILDSLCYVASVGFVGKLNLENGKYFWKHEDLYDRTKIDAFRGIAFRDDCVHFIQSSSLVEKGEPARVIIHDASGEIKEITKNVH
jgi:outer membrane protein assembly factor BamB